MEYTNKDSCYVCTRGTWHTHIRKWHSHGFLDREPINHCVYQFKWLNGINTFNTPSNKSSAGSKFGEFGKIYQYTAKTKLLYHYWLLSNFLPVNWFRWFINFIISPTKFLSFMTQLAIYTIKQSVGHIYM